MKSLYCKYKQQIHFLFFGVLTTLVNVIIYYLLAEILLLSNVLSTAVAWFGAVLFAYVTNRKWVFISDATSVKDVILELVRFVIARLATGGLDVLIMWIGVDILGYHGVVMKVLANVVVVILNYVFSKVLIFRG